jgi:hypothetical protein
MSSKKINTQININKDDSSLNDFLFVWNEFQSRPNKVTIHGDYDFELLDQLSGYNQVNKFTEIHNFPEETIVNDKLLYKIDDDIYLSHIIIDRTSDLRYLSDLIFLYKNDSCEKRIEKILQIFSEFKLETATKNHSNLQIVNLDQSGFSLEDLDYSDLDSDNCDDYYAKETWKNLSKLTKKLKKGKMGLCVFYGERGTGKSNFIKILASEVDRDIIYVPNNMIDLTLNSPEFRNFVRKYNQPILILDDCEMIFNEFFTKSNLFSNSLLQMIDGVMQNKLGVSIVTIFNVDDKSEIDHNLMDCNNLIDTIEFEYLEKEEANQLSQHLGYKPKFKDEVKLSDIINNNKDKKTTRIGF